MLHFYCILCILSCCKAAVRECGVELLLQAMQTHADDTEVVHNTCMALANVVVVATACVKQTSNSGNTDTYTNTHLHA